MKHLFVINPVSGSGKWEPEATREIEALMRGRGLDFEIVTTRRAGHAAELVREAAGNGSLRVYACGGDGTLNEVASGAAGLPNVSVTHYPKGSGNDFIKIFGSGRSRFENLGELLDAEETVFDLYECGGRYGINVGSVGFDARIGTEVHKYSRLPLLGGTSAYYASVLVNVIKGIHLPYSVDIDGKRLEGRFTMLVACNGRHYGGGFSPVPEAEPDDGLLDFLLVGPVSRLTVAKIIGSFAEGRYGEFPDIFTYMRGKRMTIEADRPNAVNIDGERLDSKNVTFAISDKSVNFFFPRGLSWKNNLADKTVPCTAK